MQYLSIKFRLSLAFFLLLFLFIFLGAFSIICLNDFNKAADQVRGRWLSSTRLIGDLNNYTSDFRAAEGTLLLGSGPADIAASEGEIAELDRNITKAQRGYEQVYHEGKEVVLYKNFADDWDKYRKAFNQVLTLVKTDKRAEGIALYKTTTHVDYDAASDALGYLTDLNVAEDQQASDYAADTYRKVRLLIMSAMVLAMLLGITGVTYIRRSISDPMLNLAENMNRLAVNDMNVDIKATDRRDEVGAMARAVVVFRNNMIDLALSRQGLVQQASMLEEKLEHERRLMTMQSNFITVASHEFRTPLNIIDGHAQRFLKMKDSLTPEDIAERTKKIRDAVSQMTDLIDNLMNSALILEGKPELYFHPQDMDLAVVLHDVCHQHQELSSKTQIIEKIDTSPLEMFGDPKLLRQVFSNLLSNATKYSPVGSIIKVSAKRDSGQVTVTVEDHGIGIPQKDINSVFERYSRGSNVTDISGTGIGLYLAKMVAELHAGKITVESMEGKGSVFTVSLPMRSS